MSKMPALAILALYLPLIYISVKRVRLSKSQIYLLSGSLIYSFMVFEYQKYKREYNLLWGKEY